VISIGCPKFFVQGCAWRQTTCGTRKN
jgi:hypothetical protein